MGRPVVCPSVFVHNFWIVITHDLYPLPLGILWSLAVEEQFYLTMPWLVKFLEPKRMIRVAIGGIFLAIGMRLVRRAAMSIYRTYWSMLMPAAWIPCSLDLSPR